MKSVIFIMFLCNVADLRPFKDLKKCKFFFLHAYVLGLIEPPLPPRTQTYAFLRPPPPLLRAYVLCE